MPPVEAPSVEDHAQGQNESDDEMPDIQQLLEDKLEEKRAKKDAAQKREELNRIKHRALEHRRSAADDESSDSGLEIEPVSEMKPGFRTKAHMDYEKRLAAVAGFRAGRHSLPTALEGSQGDATLQSAAKSTFSTRGPRNKPSQVGHRDLQYAMRQKASKQSMKLTKEKEEEWQRRGGKLLHKRDPDETDFSIQGLADLLAQAKEGNGDEEAAGEARSDSEDADDEDCVPVDRGSTSPPGGQSVAGSDDEDQAEPVPLGSDREEERQTTVDGEDTDDQGRRRSIRHAANRMIVSDSDDENKLQRPAGKVLVPETSLILEDGDRRSSTYSEGNSDKENRENDLRGPTDGDKENSMLLSPRSPMESRGLLARRSSGILSLDERARMSVSPSSRRPLQARKLSDHDLFFSGGSPKVPRQISRTSSPKDARPIFGSSLGGFSQFFHENDSAPLVDEAASTKGTLKPAFQENKSEGTFLQPSFVPKAIQKGTLSDFFSQTQASGPEING